MNSKNFTFGVEIEGLFETSLLTALESHGTVNLQHDGSVRTSEIYNKYVRPFFPALPIHPDVQEISVGIFKQQKDLMKVLAMVEANKNHFFNESCGLHLHIKAKRNRHLVEARIADLGFLKKIQTYAYTQLCDHIKSRETNSYCEPYNDMRKAKRDWTSQTKYRFIRSHDEYHTLEMRFFSPCEHKVDNVNKFLEYFFKELRNVKPIKEDTIDLIDGKTVNIQEVYRIDGKNISFLEEHGINRFTRETQRAVYKPVWARRSESNIMQMIRDNRIDVNHIMRETPQDSHDEDCHCDDDCIADRSDEGCDCSLCEEYRDN